MPKADRPLFGDLQDSFAALAGDAKQMLSLRWELAGLELREDIRSARRLAIKGAIAAILALTALPLLVAAVALGLACWTGIPTAAWLVLFASSLLFAASVTGFLAWRRFRRDFIGLAETIEELREDVVWLNEWRGRQAESSGAE
jgi:uncharacterized membrane protein YqjE